VPTIVVTVLTLDADERDPNIKCGQRPN
jgi:hypothetical protein